MSVGFYGLLDFTGIPVGVPVTVTPAGSATVGAGRKINTAYLYALFDQQRQLSIIQQSDRIIMEELSARLLLRRMEYEHSVREQQQAFNTSVNAVFLAEL